MKIIYFANIRQIIGIDHETLSINKNHSVVQIIELLKLKDEKYNRAFKNLENIKCSVNCNFVDFDKIVTNTDELAFFPPVTGG
ncbi:MAG: MoaD/ThiS family protein [Rickettsiales bacterium TMED254]|nr:molybdopterin synthase sulfur carrier subunit [Rickettsiales bacterium]RPF76863.1 MAG: MoaD/ThiS family protein [Rickettsiales bacterium TMED254]